MENVNVKTQMIRKLPSRCWEFKKKKKKRNSDFNVGFIVKNKNSY